MIQNFVIWLSSRLFIVIVILIVTVKKGFHYIFKSVHVCIQSCPIPFDPIVYSPPGPSVHGIIPARILEWVAISFSRVSS